MYHGIGTSGIQQLKSQNLNTMERSNNARMTEWGALVTGRRYVLLTVAATGIAAASAAQRLRALPPSESLPSTLLLFGSELLSSRVSAVVRYAYRSFLCFDE